GRVWEAGYRSQQQGTALTAKERRAIFAADNYSCAYCGVAGGETYPDEPLRTAKLTLARLRSAAGDKPSLLTVCDRCNTAKQYIDEADDLLPELDKLDQTQRTRLRTWI